MHLKKRYDCAYIKCVKIVFGSEKYFHLLNYFLKLIIFIKLLSYFNLNDVGVAKQFLLTPKLPKFENLSTLWQLNL